MQVKSKICGTLKKINCRYFISLSVKIRKIIMVSIYIFNVEKSNFQVKYMFFNSYNIKIISYYILFLIEEHFQDFIPLFRFLQYQRFTT